MLLRILGYAFSIAVLCVVTVCAIGSIFMMIDKDKERKLEKHREME